MLKIMATVTATNLTNSPFDFLDADNATVRFPAYGTATGDFTGSQLDLLNFWIAAGGFTEVVLNPPVNTVAPVLSDNEDPTVTPGTWTGDPAFTYQWEVSEDGEGNWSDVEGETGTSYNPTEGGYFRVLVTGTNDDGSASVYSNVLQVLR